VPVAHRNVTAAGGDVRRRLGPRGAPRAMLAASARWCGEPGCKPGRSRHC